MHYVTLRSPDLRVSRFALGGAQLGGVDCGHVDEGDLMKVVALALDHGVTFFDTADVYGLGRSEELLSHALGSRRFDVVIATKFGVNWSRPPNATRAATFRDSRPQRVIEALDGSLRRLRIDCIPLYQIHWPDPATPFADTLGVLLECRREGKIRHIGLCNFPDDVLKECGSLDEIVCFQDSYSLIDRRIERTHLPLSRRTGVGVLAYGTLVQGLLGGRYGLDAVFGPDDRRSRLPAFQGEAFRKNLSAVEALCRVGARHGKTPAQVAIAWTLRAGAVSCATVGVRDSAQLQENLGALGWDIPAEDREVLERGSPMDGASV